MRTIYPLQEAWSKYSSEPVVELPTFERETHKIEIEVSASDIFKGRATSPERCPVAIAISRTTGFRACVGRKEIYFWGRSTFYHTANLPAHARRFIRRFDGTVSWWLPPFVWRRPFKFKLTVPTYIKTTT